MEKQTDARPGRSAQLRAGVALVFFAGIGALLLLGDPARVYLWVKALHVIAVISWMAGMLYLPRLFIYHTDAPVGSVQSETFKVMEQRLLKVIMGPAMALSWIFGLYLAWTVHHFEGGWLHAKLLAVVGLSAAHGFFARSAQAFARDENRRTARFWRLINEVPTVLMILIVILVIVQPF
ncbi:protoporphyrinogen oxidase HemJ [Gellertiella hungarica]|uniref:Protoporphyrinogen IX oxidase n=1 Tax=Gellertiella hungarica TaxID=1572859 RepID=A0A7W6J8S9_9HYPH|nr:protoporphyrinogen oxidase HemJ [Gellertiella hungarica]MBB4066852.1 putative membrane protein [Gellertiella hungarica]